MVKCEICGKIIADSKQHSFPTNILNEKEYCVCIPWDALDECFRLSIFHSKKLLEDAEFLLNAEKFSSARALVILSLEETRKARD